ncbi:hypothetical protein PM082_020741 [Marasmius tenuissimus]|nr:hypothetical protein PM082_020741 [Marasmius tenuissimus]
MGTYGDDKGREILIVWSSGADLTDAQRKAQRRRIFENTIRQVENLGDRLRNLYQIHLFALVVGGQVHNDQSLQYIYNRFESQGFAEKGFVLDMNVLLAAFKSHIFEGTVNEFMNQQLVMMCEMRGLTVTGPGIDTPDTDSTSASSTKKKTSKKDVNTIQKVLLKRAEEDGITLSKLLWNKLANKLYEDGIQLYNYPVGVVEPWNTDTVRWQGVKNLSSDQQQVLIDQCGVNEEHRLTFRCVDVQDLQDSKVPILIFAPNEVGERVSVFVKDIPLDCFKKKSRPVVKSEDQDTGLPSSSQQSAILPSASGPVTWSTRRKAAVVADAMIVDDQDTGDTEGSVSDINDDDSLYVNDEEVETPRASAKQKQPVGTATTPIKMTKVSGLVPASTTALADSEDTEAQQETAKRKHSKNTLTTAKRKKLESSSKDDSSSVAGPSTTGFTDFTKLPKTRSVPSTKPTKTPSTAPSVLSVEHVQANIKPISSWSTTPSSTTGGGLSQSRASPVLSPTVSREEPTQGGNSRCSSTTSGTSGQIRSSPAPPPTISCEEFTQGNFQSLPVSSSSATTSGTSARIRPSPTPPSSISREDFA